MGFGGRWGVKVNSGFLFSAWRRFSGLAAVLLTLALPALAFGQAPAVFMTQAVNQADPSPQNGLPAAGPPGSSVRRPPDDEKGRLDVNPVTGLAVSSASNFRPLTGKERLKLYWKQNYFSVGAYFGPVFSALVLDQATGNPKEWGGGFSGFGLRVASRTGNAVLQGTVQAPLAAFLHEDVRYISSGGHGGKHRAWHAVKYSFLTYNNQGHPTLNFANLSAYYASTAISTLWLPGTYRVASYTLSNSSEQIALSVPVNLLQEFWPEVIRTVLRRPSN